MCFFNCSAVRNIIIVLGPNLMKLGSHPLKRNSGPSRLTEFTIPVHAVSWCLCAFMTLVLITSAGEQIVVAIKLAIRLAVKWVFLLDGFIPIFVTMWFFAMSYVTA